MSTDDGKTKPTYLNEVFVRQVLEKAFPNSAVVVDKWNIVLSSANGENFCSDIYRMYVKLRIYDTESAEMQVVQKKLILKDMGREIAEIGSNELSMLGMILPAMEVILEKSGKKEKLNANLMAHVLNGDAEVFVLEDLNELGYKLADRRIGLDLKHASLLMTKIAKFHAVSMAYIGKFPGEIEKLKPAHFANGVADPIAYAIAIGGMKYASKVVDAWEHFSDIAAKMRAAIGHFDERVKALVTSERHNICVINHGDLWVNNFLFSYHNGLPEDVVFVDFQNCFAGSPGFDINYFLYTSLQLDVLKRNRFDLLRQYYRTLEVTLRLCGHSEVPTWQMLMEDVRTCELIGYYAAVCEMPLCAMSAEASEDFTAATFSDAIAMTKKRETIYGSERVLETLRYTLDHFNELGVLD